VSDVAVLMPTLRRPDSLVRALRSVFAQTGVGDRLGAIVVVDNDPDGSARATVEVLRPESAFPLVYVHEPRPGVATARNAGLAATDAPLIACLDDDEEAGPGWLAALLRVQAEHDADAVFGPIQGRVPDGVGALRSYLEDFFSRAGPTASGPIEDSFGCGNSLLRRAAVLPGPRPFDPRHDQIGGEDDAVFAALKARGGRLAWAADARVEEHAPAHRATLAYALRRAFAYGQGPSQTAAREGRWLGVARWMAIGLLQAGLYGLAAPFAALVSPDRSARVLDRAVRGLGKLLWMEGFEPRVYGQAALSRTGAGAGALASS
jgi:hypothetical protein